MVIDEEDLALVMAERAITRVLHRYVQGVDRYKLDQVRSCYWDEAIDWRADLFTGTADDYVQWLSEVLPVVESISHQFTNTMITVDLSAGTATVESYCLNALVPLAVDDVPPARQLQCMRYLDDFERRGNEWRILRREMVRDWTWMLSPSAFITDSGLPTPT